MTLSLAPRLAIAAPRPALARALRWIAGGLALVAAGAVVALAPAPLNDDEAWWLQVVDRMNGGERLYRDVFSGTTPLSFWLGAGLTRALGSEALVLRAVVVIAFAATVLLAVAIARRLGLSRAGIVLVAASLAVFSPPYPGSGYTGIAVAAFLGCFGLALAWQRRGAAGARLPAVAGAVAGVCFAAKQNVGVLALGALLAAAVLVPPHGARRVRDRALAAGAAAAAFAGVAGATVAAVVASGGGAALLDYGLLGKGDYVRFGSVPYLDGAAAALAFVTGAPGEPLPSLHRLGPLFLLPPVAALALLLARRRAPAEGRARIGLTAIFCLALLAAAFPRADDAHVAPVFAAPVLALACAAAVTRAPGARRGDGRGLPSRRARSARRPPRLRTAAWLVAAGWIAVGAADRIAVPAAQLAAGDFRTSSLPHFRGVPLPPADGAATSADAQRLRAAAAGEPVFVLSAQASRLYLSAGVRNPTPFDFPLATAYGAHGKAAVAGAIERGGIASACVSDLGDGPLAPAEVRRAIRSAMRPAADLGPCVLYRRPGATP